MKRSILLVAKNAFRSVMSQRALYMWGFAVVIMFLRSAPALFAQNRPPEFMAFLRANAVSGSLDIWSYLCMAAAIYLGATSIADRAADEDDHHGAISPGSPLAVDGREVDRPVGVLRRHARDRSRARVRVSAYLGVNIEGDVLAISATRTIAGIALLAGVAIAVSTMGSAPIAVAIAMFVAIVPTLIPPLRDDPSPTYHRIGVALDTIVAPGYESHYNGVVWAPLPRNSRGSVPDQAVMPNWWQRRPEVNYGEQRKQTATTAAYAGVYFLIGCVLFTRRDLKFS